MTDDGKLMNEKRSGTASKTQETESSLESGNVHLPLNFQLRTVIHLDVIKLNNSYDVN